MGLLLNVFVATFSSIGENVSGLYMRQALKGIGRFFFVWVWFSTLAFEE